MEIIKTLNFKKKSSKVLYSLYDLRMFIADSFPQFRDSIDLGRVVVNKANSGFVDNDFDIYDLYWHITGTEFEFEVEQPTVDIDTRFILKHVRKVRKKQEKVVKLFEQGERHVGVITRKLRYRRELVSHTVKYFKIFNEIIPYQGYDGPKVNKRRILKDIIEEDEFIVTRGVKEVKKKILLEFNVKVSKKLIKNFWKKSGYRYRNVRENLCSKYPKKADPVEMLEKINELLYYMSNNIKIYFYDQKVFFLDSIPDNMWCKKKMIAELKKRKKNKRRDRIELNLCVSFDGLEAMMLVDGTTTKAEFVKIMHQLISRDEKFAKKKALIFLDNASWNNEYEQRDYLQSDYPQCFNAPYASPLNFVELFFKPINDRFHELNEHKLDKFWPVSAQSIYDGYTDDFGGLKRNYLRNIQNLRKNLMFDLD